MSHRSVGPGAMLDGKLPRDAHRRCALAALFLCCSASGAQSQPNDLAALFEPNTVLSIGALAGAGPRFQGARRAGLWGLPYFSFRRADEAPEWWSPDDGLDAALVEAGPFQAGPVLDFRDGRSKRDEPHFAGLRTLPLTVGVGVFGELWPIHDRLRLRAEITQGMRPHDGLLAKLSADLVGRFGRFTLSGGPRLVLGDTATMRLDFDVPLAAALTNNLLGPYRAAAGLRSAGGAVALAYDWSEAWQTVSYARFDRLLTTAGASPIVRRLGSANQMTVGIGAIYAFRVGP